MSTTFYKTEFRSFIRRGRCFVVATLQDDLAEFVRRKMEEQNLSTYDVARQSGGVITHAAVWGILNSQSKDVKVGTLRALAKGLKVSEDEIFAVIRGKSLNDTLHLNEIRALEFFRSLPPDKQSDVLLYLQVMSQAHGHTGAHAEGNALPHNGRRVIRRPAGKYHSQHKEHEKEQRRKQG